MTNIAFVLITHNNPAQLLRLTKALERIYAGSPIVCHHNFILCPLDEKAFPSNVQFVKPYLDARWGNISLVQAGLRALEVLYRRKDWDWFFLLSGSDYPIASATMVRTELSSSNYDLLIDIRLVQNFRGRLEGPDERGEFSFARPYWPVLAYDRYLAQHFSIELIPQWRPIRFTIRSRRLLKRLGRWPEFRVYGGDQWFGGNRRAAEMLVRHPWKPAILEFFQSKSLPDEAVYQTLVGNSDLVINGLGSRRFAKWTECSAHPKWLGLGDFDDMLFSNAWFARKFLPDDPVLDCLDKHLLPNSHAQ